jgi:hypothetical protein
MERCYHPPKNPQMWWGRAAGELTRPPPKGRGSIVGVVVKGCGGCEGVWSGEWR